MHTHTNELMIANTRGSAKCSNAPLTKGEVMKPTVVGVTFFMRALRALMAVGLTLPAQAQLLRNPVLEYCTGTWCQWCPCGDDIIENTILPNIPNSIIIGYHGPANSSSEPFSFFSGNSIISALGFSAYPTGVVDRISAAPIGREQWYSYMNTRLNTSATVRISLSKTYDPGTRLMRGTIWVTPPGQLVGMYKLNLILLEDSLVYAQTGNASCYGDPNAIHMNVVREMINGYLGESLNTSSPWAANHTITKTLNYAIPTDFVSEHCRLVAFVYKVLSPLSTGEIQQAEQWPAATTVIPEPTLYAVDNGWNIVSLPLTVADYQKTIVYPLAMSSAYAFDQTTGYVVRDTLATGEGYWLKFASSQNVSITGTPRLQDSITVRAGWNLIGTISNAVATNAIVQIPSGIVASSYYGYNGSYSQADTLQPSKGYWVKASQNGMLVLR